MDRILNVPDGGSFSKVVVCGAAGVPDGLVAGSPVPGVCGAEEFRERMGDVSLGVAASLNLVFVVLPGVSEDIDFLLDLNGEGARAEIAGLYLCAGEERVNFRLNVVHNAPGCVSNQLFKGIVAGRALTSFHGLIKVAPNAQKTEAYQESHSLLLSPSAEARTKPQLEIYADDVKCSHGATVGRLNEEEQFYMRSRGISADEARFLQMISFLSPVLAKIKDGTLRTGVSGLVEESLRRF